MDRQRDRGRRTPLFGPLPSPDGSPGHRHSVLPHFYGLPTSLVRETVPDQPANGTAEETQFAFTHPSPQMLQHGLRVGTGQPLLFCPVLSRYPPAGRRRLPPATQKPRQHSRRGLAFQSPSPPLTAPCTERPATPGSGRQVGVVAMEHGGSAVPKWVANVGVGNAVRQGVGCEGVPHRVGRDALSGRCLHVSPSEYRQSIRPSAQARLTTDPHFVLKNANRVKADCPMLDWAIPAPHVPGSIGQASFVRRWLTLSTT